MKSILPPSPKSALPGHSGAYPGAGSYLGYWDSLYGVTEVAGFVTGWASREGSLVLLPMGTAAIAQISPILASRIIKPTGAGGYLSVTNPALAAALDGVKKPAVFAFCGHYPNLPATYRFWGAGTLASRYQDIQNTGLPANVLSGLGLNLAGAAPPLVRLAIAAVNDGTSSYLCTSAAQVSGPQAGTNFVTTGRLDLGSLAGVQANGQSTRFFCSWIPVQTGAVLLRTVQNLLAYWESAA